MIHTVTPNLALDITYRMPALAPGDVNRVERVDQRAGGKGVNVARILHALGHPVTVRGLAAGPTGRAIRADLDAAGITHALTEMGCGESRRTVTVVERGSGRATGLYESGPTAGTDDWRRLRTHLAGLLPGSDALVLSGSLPPGLAASSYREVVELAREVGVPCVVDAEGDALLAALPARPDLVKPNAGELARSVGGTPEAGAADLLDRGAAAVAVSLGADGLLLATSGGTLRARPHRTLAGNPTGAGDAVVAALSRAFASHEPWAGALATATALSAAAVLSPLAGEFDRDAFRSLAAHVEVEAPAHDRSSPKE